MYQNFGIRIRDKHMTKCFEFFPEFQKVIDLTIEGYAYRTIR